MSLNINKETLLELQKLAKNTTILYVEDNQGIREKVTLLLKKFFDNVITAQDGEEGLNFFQKNHPPIVITDIKMPNMDGLKMTRRIHQLSPNTKVIITSAFDNTENLHEAIDIGVYRFLAKPLSVDKLTQALNDALHEIKLKKEQSLFDHYIQNIFNFQHNLLVLYRHEKPVIVNDTFLKYFQIDDLESFKIKFGELGNHFLEHKSFLYNTEERHWYQEAIKNLNTLYHVKMIDPNDKFHHFIFRMTKIDTSDDYYLASFDDITDLDLLRLFDEEQANLDEMKENKKTFIHLLQSVQRNNDELKLLNLYKGLTVTNRGVIVNADEDKVSIQTSYLQQRCAHYEGKIILSNSLFPADILCQTIKYVDYENQSIVIDDMQFLQHSPTQRKSVRLVPEDDHRVSLFYEEHKFGDHVKILDISANAVRLSLLSLPAGFQAEEKVHVDMVFTVGRQPLIINCEGEVMYIIEKKHEFHVVVTLKPNQTAQKDLIGYLSKRQMTLIREFKGLQYGK
ncbi:response regulator [Sulfurimonas sp. C5]|uniref:response regulator transcription factor n=1 Tax=Sulfurimonas sp. C5 TaxID=3036947 RepID=UPI00245567CE|nr:response regulator [Sulfurimonas sp. C5]MDH4943787.1 response regulator [Sulfurimonas sp. C5]